MKLSVATWSVLDLLRLRFGVTLQLFDVALEPVLGEGIPAGESLIDEPGMRERCLAVVTTAEAGSPRQASRAVVTMAIRVGREIQGVLISTMPEHKTRELRDEELAAVDAAAHIARMVIEADLALSGELSHVRESARRLQGILRFLGVLTDHATEAEMMQSVVQAATVWFDLDCRIYYRSDASTYSLYAALPGLDAHDVQGHVPADRMRAIAGAGRVTGPGDLEDLGWRSRRGEALLLPFGRDPDWIMLVGGAITADVELTFHAITHVLTSGLQRAASERDAYWRDRLAAGAVHPHATAERIASGLLAQLSTELGGASVRLSVASGGVQRTLAAVWQAGNPDRVLVESFPLDANSTVTLEVSRTTDVPSFEQLVVTRAWAHAVQPWLRGAAVAMEYGDAIAWDPAAAAFEHRIDDEVERAKRFNLGLGLVLVRAEGVQVNAAADPLLRIIRPELRASDLTGHVRGGMLAILLVHAGAEGADSVVSRLRRRLQAATEHLGVRIGHAMFTSECATGEALIRTAQGHLRELTANS